MIRRPPRSTQGVSSAASDVYKRQEEQVCLQNKKVIDIGCGGGILSESMWERGASVTGVDAGQGPISVARLHARERSASIDYRQGTVEELVDHESGQYDVVTCMELLEHVPSPAQTISACAALARVGGHVFFSTINRNPKSWLFAIVGAEYALCLLYTSPSPRDGLLSRMPSSA